MAYSVTPCIHFECKESQCEHAYNGVCTGYSFTGHEMCGCEACLHHKRIGDIEDCTCNERIKDISSKDSL